MDIKTGQKEAGRLPEPDPAEFERKILKRIPLEILLLSAVLALAALFIISPITAIFFFAGGLLSSFSFLWLVQSLGRFLLQGKKKALKSGILFYALRIVLILAIFLFIIYLHPKELLAFAAGFSTVILVFLGEAARALTSMKQWKS
jgi:hypothetical protein